MLKVEKKEKKKLNPWYRGSSIKKIKKTFEVQYPYNLILKDKIKKKTNNKNKIELLKSKI
jgi:hypothetical protein